MGCLGAKSAIGEHLWYVSLCSYFGVFPYNFRIAQPKGPKPESLIEDQ
jgi:hypothetical protein